MEAQTALAEHLLAIYRMAKHVLAAIAERQDLNVNQVITLRLLKTRGRLTMSDLTPLLDVTRGAVTGLVDRLEEMGLVTRLHSPYDRRVIFLEPTEEGLRRLASIREAWDEQVANWAEGLASSELDALVASVAKLRTQAERLADDLPRDRC